MPARKRRPPYPPGFPFRRKIPDLSEWEAAYSYLRTFYPGWIKLPHSSVRLSVLFLELLLSRRYRGYCQRPIRGYHAIQWHGMELSKDRAHLRREAKSPRCYLRRLGRKGEGIAALAGPPWMEIPHVVVRSAARSRRIVRDIQNAREVRGFLCYEFNLASSLYTAKDLRRGRQMIAAISATDPTSRHHGGHPSLVWRTASEQVLLNPESALDAVRNGSIPAPVAEPWAIPQKAHPPA